MPNTIWIALAAGIVAIFISERTTIGRRFVAVSVSAPAAHAVAIPVERYRIGTYVAAGLLYAVGGVDWTYGENFSTNVYRYDGTNWTEVAGLPAPRGAPRRRGWLQRWRDSL